MREYNLINRCLSILKSSRMDVMTQLRMESLLVGMKMLMLVDLEERDTMPDFEELFRRVEEVSTDQSPDGVNGLFEHARKMQTSMVACLNLSC